MSLCDLSSDKVVEILELLDVPSKRAMAQVSRWFYDQLRNAVQSEQREPNDEITDEDFPCSVPHNIPDDPKITDRDSFTKNQKGDLTTFTLDYKEFDTKVIFCKDNLGRLQGNYRVYTCIPEHERWSMTEKQKNLLILSKTDTQYHFEDGKLQGKFFYQSHYGDYSEFGHITSQVHNWSYCEGILHGKYYRKEYRKEWGGPIEYDYSVQGFYDYGYRTGMWYVDDPNRSMYSIVHYKKGLFHGKAIITGQIHYRISPCDHDKFDIVRLEISFYEGVRHGPLTYSIIRSGTDISQIIFQSKYFWGQLEEVVTDDRKPIDDWYGLHIDLSGFEQKDISDFSIYIPHHGLM